MRFHSGLFLLFPLTLAGCDFGGGTVGCDFPDDSRCQERTGLQATSFGPACDASGGDVLDGGCPDEGKVGGCDLTVAGTSGEVHDWYYEPVTRDEAEGNCGESEPFMEP